MNEDGSISIVGRNKDMIIKGGENVYPTEVEQFLFKLPYVADAQVIGVPDDRLGETVCAWIRLQSAEKGKITPEKIKEDCRGKIMSYKIPTYIMIKEEKDFPLTATGKVQKFKLREISKKRTWTQLTRSHRPLRKAVNFPPQPPATPQQTLSQPNNTNLLEYASYILTNCGTPQYFETNTLHSTFHLGNSCVSPIVIIRAWGLLTLVGRGKTKTQLTKNIAKMIGCDQNEIHQILGNVGKAFFGAVNFFADYPKRAVLDDEVILCAGQYYKNRNGNPLSTMCFDCDPDGMRSIFLINQTIREATNERVQYVVREEHAPNRVAMTVLTSAIDCTFYWKHDAKSCKLDKWHFRTGDNISTVNGWIAVGNFYHKRSTKGIVVRLDSYQPKLNLILFIPTGETPPTASEVLEAGKNLPTPHELVKIFVPQFCVATPLSLRECSKEGPFNMKRVFDREKADLTGHLKQYHGFSPMVTPLWDHYHKTVFNIVNGDTEPTVLKKVSRLQTGYQDLKKIPYMPDLATQRIKYYEDHLPISFAASSQVVGHHNAASGDVVLDEPFYFLVVQDLHGSPLIHCFGRFTNLDFVSQYKSKQCNPSV